MSDLISRSEVIDLLYKTFDEYRISTDKTSKLEGFGSEVFKRVREMPTAYDIDKVVEELEELAESHRQAGFDVEKNGFSNVANKMYGKQCAFMQAIEIVKQGSVTDEVCEWTKYDYKTIRSPHKRDWSIPSMKDFKYCPYCGKKIKAVE